MPIKRSEVSKSYGKEKRAIQDFLQKHRDELFSVDELAGALSEGGVFASGVNVEKAYATTRAALARLIAIGKVDRLDHQGKDYFGLK